MVLQRIATETGHAQQGRQTGTDQHGETVRARGATPQLRGLDQEIAVHQQERLTIQAVGCDGHRRQRVRPGEGRVLQYETRSRASGQVVTADRTILPR